LNYSRVLFNKRRANGFDNSIIGVPIILNDDFYVQPTACLSDIIHETYEQNKNIVEIFYSFFFLQLSRSIAKIL